MVPLLQTKLYPPAVRTDLVPRQRLFKLLEQGLEKKLTLLSAPAGFGKSTLVAAWLAQQAEDVTAAWLTIDVNDNDPIGFLTYLIGAFQRGESQIGQAVLPLLQEGPSVKLEPLLTSLLNDLAGFNGRLLLILDDYHLIQEPAIHEALAYLLSYLPTHIHLILLCRSDPPLPLARLRVEHALLEIDSRQMRFTQAETAQFLNGVMQLGLSPADIAQLGARTEGWIASLQLAALSIKEAADPGAVVAAFTGDNRYVIDYLMGEVLERQPGYIRDFLLQTAVLKRLNVQLCNAVTGQVGGQHILEDLEQRNLFVIPLDNQRRWYRYHQLFAEFLQNQLARTQPELLPELQRRASDWFAAQGEIDEAIEHALLIPDFPLAAKLMTRVANAMLWEQSRANTFLRWAGSLPQAVLFSHHRLALLLAWAYLFTGGYQRLASYMDELEDAWGEISLVSDDDRGELAALRGEMALYRSDLSVALTEFEAALALLSPDNQHSRGITLQILGYAYRLEGQVGEAQHTLEEAIRLVEPRTNFSLWVFAHTDLAEVYAMRGQITQAHQLLQQLLASLPEAERRTRTVLAGVWVSLGGFLAEQGELAAAIETLRMSIELARTAGFSSLQHFASTRLAPLLVAAGEVEAGKRLMAEAREQGVAHGTPWVLQRFECAEAGLALQIGDLAAASGWGARVAARRTVAGEERPFMPAYVRHLETIMLARVHLAQKRFDAAEQQAQSALSTALAREWQLSAIDCHLILASVAAVQNRYDSARQALKAALGLAEPEGLNGRFLPYLAALRGLLPEVASEAFMARFLTEPTSAEQELIEPLSPRELEILQLMGEGLSNRQIGERLIIALGTVGKHTSNIFAKLGVSNRATAVLRARELDLI